MSTGMQTCVHPQVSEVYKVINASIILIAVKSIEWMRMNFGGKWLREMKNKGVRENTREYICGRVAVRMKFTLIEFVQILFTPL